MVGIKSVTIQNFQSHKDTRLELDKGLNVIIGPSDQGKSAVIRAIKWVLFNEPRGLEFIRHGETTAKVSVEFSNGHTIIRERSKSKNRYTVIDEEGSSTVFEGFGNEVPEEIIKAHGIPKVVLDTDVSSALNVSDQLEGPFLLSETGAVRAKAIGRLTGIHILDNSIRDCIADIRRENQTKDRVTTEISDIDNKLVRYESLDSLGEKILELEKVIEKIQILTNRLELLEVKKAGLQSLQKEYSDIAIKLDSLTRINDYASQIKSVDICINRLKQFEKTKIAISQVEEGINLGLKVLEKTNRVNNIHNLIDEIKQKSSKLKKLSIINEGLKKLDEELKKEGNILRKTEALDDMSEILKLLKNKTDKCEKISRIMGKIYEWKASETELAISTQKLGNIDVQTNILSDISDKIIRAKKLDELNEKYKQVSSQINEGNKYMSQNSYELIKMTKEYKEKLKAIGKCPVCNSLLDEGKLSEIIRHYEEVH